MVLTCSFSSKMPKICPHVRLDFRVKNFFYCTALVIIMLKRALFGEVKKFFLVWSVLGKVKISRFFVKALRARYARYARSAPRPAFGRPWRALRWDKTKSLKRNGRKFDFSSFKLQGPLYIFAMDDPVEIGFKHPSKL